MADIKSPEKRSQNMAKIRSRDTTPEVWLRKKLFSYGYRYRKNVSSVIGHPDAFFAKYNTALFVHGCFWHRHLNCKYAYMPKTRVEFWEEKFARNIARDETVRESLLEKQVKMLVVWECTVKRMMRSNDAELATMTAIEAFLKSDDLHLEL